MAKSRLRDFLRGRRGRSANELTLDHAAIGDRLRTLGVARDPVSANGVHELLAPLRTLRASTPTNTLSESTIRRALGAPVSLDTADQLAEMLQVGTCRILDPPSARVVLARMRDPVQMLDQWFDRIGPKSKLGAKAAELVPFLQEGHEITRWYIARIPTHPWPRDGWARAIRPDGPLHCYGNANIEPRGPLTSKTLTFHFSARPFRRTAKGVLRSTFRSRFGEITIDRHTRKVHLENYFQPPEPAKDPTLSKINELDVWLWVGDGAGWTGGIDIIIESESCDFVVKWRQNSDNIDARERLPTTHCFRPSPLHRQQFIEAERAAQRARSEYKPRECW